MTLREQLILVSDTFGQARGLGRQRVSTIVLNRGSTLDGVAIGEKDVTTGTFERAMQWFSDNWPEGAEWPTDVGRPQPVMEAA
ncbi:MULTISPECIES: hypothetical protein [unclassified Rhizobium]|uniref:hypothetical protein n=1 Tax=unclassified Rhizobium TaxID=2613769 RepID=UPI00146D8DA0|nr:MULTISPECIES: hypothetical protein [unclassified Rhizobium]MBD9445781.1 hypothetical protein [Rhizobium sp. RHZ01]